MGTYTGTPKTWTTSEVVTAAMLNAEVRDPLLAFGALTSYTPTLGGFTTGNGTLAGGYLQVEKLVIFWASFTFGTTSAAATAVPTLSFPVTASASSLLGTYHGLFIDTSAGSYYQAAIRASSSTTVGLFIMGGSGAQTALTTTTPFTWASTDVIRVSGMYEAA